jgi:hypothetical protein
MKHKQSLIKLVNIRIEEHKIEIEKTTKELDNFSNKQGLSRDTILLNAQKKIILKDKILFHTACVKAIEDIKTLIAKYE